MGQEISVFWFRRDLRLKDNHGLAKALQGPYPVLPLFIFDKNILDELESKDARLQFIHQELGKIKSQLEEYGSSLLVYHDEPQVAWKQLLKSYEVKEVYTNRDYEPYAQDRDKKIYNFLKFKGIPFKGYKDQVIFEKSEIVKDNGDPYVVYTPYMKKYKQALNASSFEEFPSHEIKNFAQVDPLPMPSLANMGFESMDFDYPSREAKVSIIANYHDTRDIPSKLGTTRLSLHLRFGTVSIRQLAKLAHAKNEKFFNELIWRDFYQQVLFHFPHSFRNSFRREYDAIQWENNENHFKAWCEGKTGYPLVDAGMRELNRTGFMHNRVRMLVASFLTKHLLIDWRWGEAYFAKRLLDYDAASNIGGWQWAAGSGVDAAPYFRIFNPETQLKKFDPDLEYVRKWVPEYGTSSYPQPIVEHKKARERALERYKQALK